MDIFEKTFTGIAGTLTIAAIGTVLAVEIRSCTADSKHYSTEMPRLETSIAAELTRVASITPSLTPKPTITYTPTLTLTPTNTPTATEIPLGIENNPFIYPLNYTAEDSFGILESKVENLKGTVVESYLGHTSVWVGNSGGGGSDRYFSWLVLRDQTNTNLYYLIYPAERVFQKGAKVNIEAYWPIKENTTLMNNMMVYLTNQVMDENIHYYGTFDFPIQSSAQDGHVDGIIKFNGVEYLASGPISLDTPTPIQSVTPTQTPEAEP